MFIMNVILFYFLFFLLFFFFFYCLFFLYVAFVVIFIFYIFLQIIYLFNLESAHWSSYSITIPGDFYKTKALYRRLTHNAGLEIFWTLIPTLLVAYIGSSSFSL